MTSVSVIIPCFNCSQTIVQCIESVFNQTYPLDKVICIDNNSTDDTLKKLRCLSKIYSIEIIEEPRQGACAARNTGLRLTNSDWIQFLDADDRLLPNKIGEQIELIPKENEVRFIVGKSVCHLVNGRSRKTMVSKDPWKGLFVNMFGNTCSNLWGRKSLIEVGGWNEDLLSSQETDLMFRLLKVKSSGSVLFSTQYSTIINARDSNRISTRDTAKNLVRYANLRLKIAIYLKESQAQYWHRNKKFFLRNIIILCERLHQINEIQQAKIIHDFVNSETLTLGSLDWLKSKMLQYKLKHK